MIFLNFHNFWKVFSVQNKRKTLSWKSSQIFLWLESVFCWPTFLMTSKHMKVWKVVSRKPLSGQTNAPLVSFKSTFSFREQRRREEREEHNRQGRRRDGRWIADGSCLISSPVPLDLCSHLLHLLFLLICLVFSF